MYASNASIQARARRSLLSAAFECWLEKELGHGTVPQSIHTPFPWENSFGFHLAGMVGHDFFKPYAVTFDFDAM